MRYCNPCKRKHRLPETAKMLTMGVCDKCRQAKPVHTNNSFHLEFKMGGKGDLRA